MCCKPLVFTAEPQQKLHPQKNALAYLLKVIGLSQKSPFSALSLQLVQPMDDT